MSKLQEATMKLMHLMRQSWMTRRGRPAPPPTLTAQQKAEIEECFEMLDSDGSGAIDVDEIISAFGDLGFNINREGITEMMNEADPDGSGELEFDEFLSLMGRAIYHPDANGKELVASTAAGSVSFADAVRAFRRKKLIESLIQGGRARHRVLEFHERVQGLIRAEAAELRQRQATHAIFERMETARLERERLSKVADPESKRTKKVKARLHAAISRSLGAFEGLYRDVSSGTMSDADLTDRSARNTGRRHGQGQVSEPPLQEHVSLQEHAAAMLRSYSERALGGNSGRSILRNANRNNRPVTSDSDSDSNDSVPVPGRRRRGGAASPGSVSPRSRGSDSDTAAASSAAAAAAAVGGTGGALLSRMRSRVLAAGAAAAAGSSLSSSPLGSAPPTARGTGGVTFLTEANVAAVSESHAASPWTPPPLVRSASLASSVDSTTAKITRRVGAAVLRYFKGLEESTKKQEAKYDDSARLNASFVAPPVDRSEYRQALIPSRPVSRVATHTPTPNPRAASPLPQPSSTDPYPGAPGAMQPTSTNHTGSSTAAVAAGFSHGLRSPSPGAAHHPHAWGVRQLPHSQHKGALQPSSRTGTPSPAPGAKPHGLVRSSSPGPPGLPPTRTSHPAMPSSLLAAQAAASLACPPPGRRSIDAVSLAQMHAAATAAAAAAAAGGSRTASPLPTGPSGPTIPNRAWRQAPAFSPSGVTVGPAFGWGAGTVPHLGGGGAGPADSTSPIPAGCNSPLSTQLLEAAGGGRRASSRAAGVGLAAAWVADGVWHGTADTTGGAVTMAAPDPRAPWSPEGSPVEGAAAGTGTCQQHHDGAEGLLYDDEEDGPWAGGCLGGRQDEPQQGQRQDELAGAPIVQAAAADGAAPSDGRSGALPQLSQDVHRHHDLQQQLQQQQQEEQASGGGARPDALPYVTNPAASAPESYPSAPAPGTHTGGPAPPGAGARTLAPPGPISRAWVASSRSGRHHRAPSPASPLAGHGPSQGPGAGAGPLTPSPCASPLPGGRSSIHPHPQTRNLTPPGGLPPLPSAAHAGSGGSAGHGGARAAEGGGVGAGGPGVWRRASGSNVHGPAEAGGSSNSFSHASHLRPLPKAPAPESMVEGLVSVSPLQQQGHHQQQQHCQQQLGVGKDVGGGADGGHVAAAPTHSGGGAGGEPLLSGMNGTAPAEAEAEAEAEAGAKELDMDAILADAEEANTQLRHTNKQEERNQAAAGLHGAGHLDRRNELSPDAASPQRPSNTNNKTSQHTQGSSNPNPSPPAVMLAVPVSNVQPHGVASPARPPTRVLPPQPDAAFGLLPAPHRPASPSRLSTAVGAAAVAASAPPALTPGTRSRGGSAGAGTGPGPSPSPCPAGHLANTTSNSNGGMHTGAWPVARTGSPLPGAASPVPKGAYHNMRLRVKRKSSAVGGRMSTSPYPGCRGGSAGSSGSRGQGEGQQQHEGEAGAGAAPTPVTLTLAPPGGGPGASQARVVVTYYGGQGESGGSGGAGGGGEAAAWAGGGQGQGVSRSGSQGLRQARGVAPEPMEQGLGGAMAAAVVVRGPSARAAGAQYAAYLRSEFAVEGGAPGAEARVSELGASSQQGAQQQQQQLMLQQTPQQQVVPQQQQQQEQGRSSVSAASSLASPYSSTTSLASPHAATAAHASRAARLDSSPHTVATTSTPASSSGSAQYSGTVPAEPPAARQDNQSAVPTPDALTHGAAAARGVDRQEAQAPSPAAAPTAPASHAQGVAGSNTTHIPGSVLRVATPPLPLPAAVVGVASGQGGSPLYGKAAAAAIAATTSASVPDNGNSSTAGGTSSPAAGQAQQVAAAATAAAGWHGGGMPGRSPSPGPSPLRLQSRAAANPPSPHPATTTATDARPQTRMSYRDVHSPGGRRPGSRVRGDGGGGGGVSGHGHALGATAAALAAMRQQRVELSGGRVGNAAYEGQGLGDIGPWDVAGRPMSP